MGPLGLFGYRSQLAQLPSDLREHLVSVVCFAQQAGNGDSQRAQQLLPVQRPDERSFEAIADLRRKLVESLSVTRREIAASARERQGVVANAADAVLRVPPQFALDADHRMRA